MARRGARVSPEARREAILKAARACFSRGGYHATTIDDIALDAGLSKGAVYWHFEGKWELFVALLDGLMHGLEEQLVLPREHMTGRERIEYACQVILSSDPGGPGMAELQAEFMAHASRDTEVRRRFSGMGQRTIQFLVDAVEHGVRSGEFRPVDAESVALGILAALDGLQVHQLLRPDLDVNRVWQETVDQLIRGMEVR
jgi:AcrR family transcriptional regulator